MNKKKINPKPLIALTVVGEPYKAKLRPTGEDRLLLPMSDGRSYTVSDLVAMMPKDQASGLPVLTKSCITSRLRNRLVGWSSPTLFWPPAEPGRRVDGKKANQQGQRPKKSVEDENEDENARLSGVSRAHKLREIPGPGIWERNHG